VNDSHARAHSRLFLSADLVGSTARKQAKGVETWLGDVLAFYQQFPFRLDETLQDSLTQIQASGDEFELTERPTLWKAVGDELIFTAEVAHEHDVCVLIEAWIRAMSQTEQKALEKGHSGLKGAAWIATFPLPDRAVAVPVAASYDPDLEPEVVNRDLLTRDGPPGEVAVDYLGPGVDIGFRVASCATPRKFALSIEAAWAVAVSRMNRNDASAMYFEGEIALKGVWGGRGYPLFWLDTDNNHGAQPVLDQLLRLEGVDNTHVRNLAKKLDPSDDWPCRLHLPKSGFPELRSSSAEIEAEAEKLMRVDDTTGDVDAYLPQSDAPVATGAPETGRE
jgi:hypothetical protein